MLKHPNFKTKHPNSETLEFNAYQIEIESNAINKAIILPNSIRFRFGPH
jgi:hypothetical protein